MKNAIQIVNGKEFDLNGFEMNRKGSTPYVGVLAEMHKGEIQYCAYRQCGKHLMFGLYISRDIAPCVWVANHYRKNAAVYDKTLATFGSTNKAAEKGLLWGQQFDIPSEFEYEVFTKDTVPVKEKSLPKHKAQKITPKETNITEEFVGRQVNTLLGNKVDVKTRIKIKEMVVANTAFYRTPEDVTNYVNDLVKYNIK